MPTTTTAAPAGYWLRRGINSATFDLKTYFQSIPNFYKLIDTPEGRRALTRYDPLLFPILYLRRHITATHLSSQLPTFADPHFVWARQALTWATHNTNPPLPHSDRHAFVAPRECGKSTWWFLILPMWAAAHQHKRFVAAFASAATQAESHLKTFKQELDQNPLLRYDYPDLTNPQRTSKGQPTADRDNQFNAANGFVFIARGIDSSNLGLKVENLRPDLILLDDIEPDEANYSPDLAQKRLGTMLEAIFPMNIRATVIIVGTTVMYNSIIHQLVRSNKHHPQHQIAEWISDNNIKVHHARPLKKTTTTNERSIWPSKWPLDFLISIRHTRSYHKNYENDPRSSEGAFWTEADITYATLPYTTRTALFIDPRVKKQTTKRTDYTGLAVVSWCPAKRVRNNTDADPASTSASTYNPFPDTPQSHVLYGLYGLATGHTVERHPGLVQIEHAEQTQLTGKPLARHILRILAQFPKIQRVVVETNQGGDLWLEAFDGLPVPVHTHFSKDPKPIRFADALEFYQKTPPLVVHTAPFPDLEQQYLAYPIVKHDDVADAATAGVLYFLKRPIRQQVRISAKSYI